MGAVSCARAVERRLGERQVRFVVDRAAVFRRRAGEFGIIDRNGSGERSKRAAVRRGIVDKVRVVNTERTVGHIDGAAEIIGNGRVKVDVRNDGVAACEIDRAAVRRARVVKGDVLNAEGSHRAINGAERGFIAGERRLGDFARLFVHNALDVRVAKVVNERARSRNVVLERGRENDKFRVGVVENKVAEFHLVVGKGQILEREQTFVLKDGARLGRDGVEELEVANGGVRLFRNAEEARIVRRTRNRQIELIPVRIDAIESERLIERERTMNEFEGRAVEVRGVGAEDDRVRFAGDASHERESGLVRIGFAVENDLGTGGDLRADARLALVNERAVLIDHAVTVCERNFRAFLQRELVSSDVDVHVGAERKINAADGNDVAVDEGILGRFGNNETILRVSVHGGLSVAEGNDGAVLNDRDVVGGDASEDAVDDRDFRAVFELKDAEVLNVVARVACDGRNVRPDAVDERNVDAVDHAVRSVRDRRLFSVRINIDVDHVGHGNAYRVRPLDRFSVGRGVRVRIRVEPVDAVVDVFDAVARNLRSDRNALVGAFGVDEFPVCRVPNRGIGDFLIEGELFARIDLIFCRGVDEELSVLNEVCNAVRFEDVSVLERDFAVIEATGVDFDRFAERNQTVVRIDDVDVRGDDDRIVNGDRGLDDVEVGSRREEVVVFAEFFDVVCRVDLISEDEVALFVLLGEIAVRDQALHEVFNRAERNVFEEHIALDAVVFKCLDFAGGEIRAGNGRGTARHSAGSAEIDGNLHDRQTRVFRRARHHDVLRGVRIVLPEIYGRLEVRIDALAFVNEGEVQIERLVDEERRDGTRLIVDGARHDNGAFPRVDDVGAGGRRNVSGEFRLIEKFERAGVDGRSADTRLTGEVGVVSRFIAANTESIVIRRGDVRVRIVKGRRSVRSTQIDGRRIALESEIPELPEFRRPVGEIIFAESDELRVDGNDVRAGRRAEGRSN